jgi:hypothetical protein
VLLHVNQQQGRAGIASSYQDPGVLGGGSNNVQLLAGHRIWLVSPAYSKALEAVPSGSLTGGAVAKAKRFVGHLEDILHSVTRSPQHFGEVAGEFAEAIRDHMPEIVGIVAGFIMAEAASAFLAATPTGVGQIAATVIQLGLSAFGAAGAIQAGAEALKHAGEWLTIAWTAQGKDDRIAAASRSSSRCSSASPWRHSRRSGPRPTTATRSRSRARCRPVACRRWRWRVAARSVAA